MSEDAKDRRSGKSLGPWLAVLGLFFLFELPTALAPDRIDASALRPTGDLLAVFTLYTLTFWSGFGRSVRWFRWALALTVVVLVLVRVDRAVFFVLSRSEPLLYDQLFMLRHLFVLIGDLWGWQVLLGILGVLAAGVLLAFGARALLRRAQPLFEPPRIRTTAAVGAAAWVGVLSATALSPRGASPPWIRWMTPDLAANVVESRRIYRAVQESVSESPYRDFDRVHLERKPDFLLFFVESYGKLIAENPGMRPIWTEDLNGLTGRLEKQGWHMASGYCTAPVSGGRSWLAVASILMGTTVRYEAVHRQLMDHVDRLPTLVNFFAKHGYATIHLAPSDRVRPGIQDENHYGYEKYVRFTDLDYHGPRKGWGIVPDQYALAHTEENVLAHETRPVFFNFHMVSSHSPWVTVPAYVPDWRSLNAISDEPPDNLLRSEIGRRLQRYTRLEARDSYMGELTASFREGYERAVLYDFRVIEDFLSRRKGDPLVVIMGDHQPPVVAPETVSFDVPVHVLARDPALLDEFREHGFTNGLVLSAEQGPVVQHAGLFSLFVRAMARATGGEAPKYFPKGIGLGS